MLTSGLFTTHCIEIECELGKPFRLIPFGDVHRDSDMHSSSYWNRFLERARYAAINENALFLGMGDYGDGASTSERIVLDAPGLHDTTKRTMNNVYKGVAQTIVNELAFMKGRIIGMLGGNHYFDFGNGDTTDTIVAAALNTKFLGVCAFIRLSIIIKGTGDKRRCHYDIFAHHGKGGGNLPGSTFNTLEKMSSSAIADLYLMGHDHKKGCIPSSPRLTLVGYSKKVTVRQRVPWLGRTGSFLKAYEDGRVSYNVDAARSPAALGWIEFEITPVRIREDGDDFIELQVRGTS